MARALLSAPHMSRGKQGWVAILALAGACASPVGADVGVEDDEVPEPAEPALVHATGGYFEHARSPLVPFCHGVLIAPDVVVTAANCAADGWFELSFGIGEPGASSTVAVDQIIEHPLGSADPAHAIVALVLAKPVVDVVPADVLEVDEMPCDVELPTYEVVLGGDIARRSIWRACGASEPGSLVAVDGFPNCHGDSGAGAFLSGPRDRVIGWVTGAGHLGPQHPVHEACVTSVQLATVAANREFLAQARARTRVQDPF